MEKNMAPVKKVMQTAAAMVKKSSKYETTAEEMTTTLRNETNSQRYQKSSSTRRLDGANEAYRCISAINMARNASKELPHYASKNIPITYNQTRR
jgi:RPA family protein